MDCHRTQDAIVDSFIEPSSAEAQAMVEAHLAGCDACAAFLDAQRNLDRELGRVMARPALSAGFRAAVRGRIRREARNVWSDLLPDVVHFASCGVAGVLGLAWLPLSAPVVLAMAAAGALLTHVVLTAAHDSFDAADETAF